MHRYIITYILLLFSCSMMAQSFFNLGADEVRIDSVLPVVRYVMPLPANHADSLYIADIKYAEYADMTASELKAYQNISPTPLPTRVEVRQNIVTSRKQPSMIFSLSPFVMRNGRPQILVSYMLDIKAFPRFIGNAKGRAGDKKERYAEHSVLASGRWAKISVEESGIHQLTEAVVRQAGFRDINKVKIYGYGGNLVPEILTDEYLRSHDDLMEVPSVNTNGRRLFYANGPVHWDYNERIRNPYSMVGCYFITESDDDPLIVSEEELLADVYPSDAFHNTLSETDNYAWYAGGRNLVNATQISDSRTYTINSSSKESGNGTLTVAVSAAANTTYTVTLNDKVINNIGEITMKNYDKAAFSTGIYAVNNITPENKVKIEVSSGGPIRLDYISLYNERPAPKPELSSGTFPQAKYVYNITNQDHHADEAVDLTIIIPTSQHFLQQAERLKAHHEEHDGMTVRIVPADELYNEFSSGTPDVSAYRRYMKMMYDRAQTEADMPKHLLLFGDCVWDNRLLTSECRRFNADNLLLCHESENSYNAVYCYVSDDFIGILDDNESLTDNGDDFYGTPDIGIGRFPAITEAEAKTMVDKVISYAKNANVGEWQNTMMFLGDDGNNNLHMTDVNKVADNIISQFPGYYVRKIMWDAYKRVESSTGNRYPDVEEAIKAQQRKGALLIDYAGHGAANSISHEYVLRLSDFQTFNNVNLPIWITASCDIGPFDGVEETIGETVLTNSKGGGIAFFGTTRTVYANYNKYINEAFVKAVLSTTNGKRNTLGDAVRLAKNYIVAHNQDLTVNKVQYSLLGDPALTLNTPQSTCVIDSINGVSVKEANLPIISANSKVRISGHIEKNGQLMEDMDGLVSIMVRDNEEEVACQMNDKTETPRQFKFKDRNKTIFSGTDNVHNGRFSATFSVPRDINYSNERGLITLFAYTEDASVTANGETDRFIVGGSEVVSNDSIGPSVFCYLNSPSFTNGGNVNATPFFVAEIRDKDGINASGSGIGHDMQLVIDNDASQTYNLNEHFQFDFGSYTSGSTFLSMPRLSEGRHTLRFRAWDILNNPSTVTLSFNVVDGQTPTIADVNVTRNPAKTSTMFIVTHDRPGSDLDISVEIFDASGRLMHVLSQTATPETNTSAINWDLTNGNGARLQAGVYLYRINISGPNTSSASKAKKLIIAKP